MANLTTVSILEHPFVPVKSPLNSQLPLFPNTVIHHSNSGPVLMKGNKEFLWTATSYYGVSSASRVLSPQLLLKKFDYVRQGLQTTLALTAAQREAVLRLLRLYAYYGKVYPKAAMVCEEPGCSIATFWRTIKYLKEMGLIEVINRYLTPYRRQISNLYRLDKLILLIARYLAEHGTQFLEKWLKPYLQLPGRDFWGLSIPDQGARAGPS